MRLICPFSDPELAEILPMPPSVEELALARALSNSAIAWFAGRLISPALSDENAASDKARALGLLFYRQLALVKTAGELNQPYHFQSLAAAARTVFEIAVDVELLGTDKVDNAAEKFHVFTRVARWRSSKKRVSFYDLNPPLDSALKTDEARALLKRSHVETDLEEKSRRLWGQELGARGPEHWSGIDLAERTRRVGVDYLEDYRRDVDKLNWYVHGHAAGVGGIGPEGFAAVKFLSHELIDRRAPRSFFRVAEAWGLPPDVGQFFDQLGASHDQLATCLLADVQRSRLGYRSRFSDGFEALLDR